MRVLLLFGCLMLAGCVEDAPEQETEPISTPAPREASSSHWVNTTLDLTETQVSSPAGRTGLGGANCAGFDIDQVVAGTAVATWTPVIPALSEIELGVFGEDGRQRVTGSSPLTLEFQEERRDEFFDVIHIMVQAPEVGAAIEQQVTVEVSMRVVGGSGDYSQGSCSFA